MQLPLPCRDWLGKERRPGSQRLWGEQRCHVTPPKQKSQMPPTTRSRCWCWRLCHASQRMTCRKQSRWWSSVVGTNRIHVRPRSGRSNDDKVWGQPRSFPNIAFTTGFGPLGAGNRPCAAWEQRLWMYPTKRKMTTTPGGRNALASHLHMADGAAAVQTTESQNHSVDLREGSSGTQ